MEKHGFKIIDAIRIPNYRGSIRISATLNKNFKQKKNVQKLLNFEKKKGYYSKSKYKRFSKDIIKSKNNLIKILKNIKREGKNIVGIGCPTDDNLLSYCKINGEILDYIAEQNILKAKLVYTKYSHTSFRRGNFFENPLNMH